MITARPLTVRLATALLALSAVASAATVKGSVTNMTTAKPAVGDDVVLLDLTNNMEEAARTKTDSRGQFSFDAPDGKPYLVRVIHDKVTYHKPLPPGTTSADVTVYDAAPKVAGVTATIGIIRMEAQSGTLSVTQDYEISNTSKPPRTEMADKSFFVSVPEGAKIDDGMAAAPGGMPLRSMPAPDPTQNGRYYFVFPLRPGDTRFEVSYHMPYSGNLTFTPNPQYEFQHFAIMTPQSMQITPAAGASYQPMPQKDGVVAQLATNVKPGDNLAVTISGTGVFPRDTQQGGDETAQSGGGAPRPGGGLGTPENGPNPLQPYQWYILSVLGVVLVGGAVYSIRRPRAVPAAAAAAGKNGSGGAVVTRSGNLLDALKEELFQLEVERQQGRISAQEYEKAKASLDQVISRALKRTSA